MITITKPTEEDILGIQEVFYKTWLITYPNEEVGITREDVEEHFKNAFSLETVESRKQTLLNLPINHLFLVAKDGNKVVGVSRFINRDTCNQLQSIYVLPEYQGKGIGQLFWGKAVDFFDPQKETIVQVAIYNNQAIHFYQKLGFVDNGKRFSEERHRMPISNSLIPEMEMVLKNLPVKK